MYLEWISFLESSILLYRAFLLRLGAFGSKESEEGSDKLFTREQLDSQRSWGAVVYDGI